MLIILYITLLVLMLSVFMFIFCSVFSMSVSFLTNNPNSPKKTNLANNTISYLLKW